MTWIRWSALRSGSGFISGRFRRTGWFCLLTIMNGPWLILDSMRKSGRWWWEAGRLNTDVHGWHGFSALFRELFFFVVVLFVVMLESFPDEFCCRRVGDFVDGSRFGEVEPFGGGFDGAD